MHSDNFQSLTCVLVIAIVKISSSNRIRELHANREEGCEGAEKTVVAEVEADVQVHVGGGGRGGGGGW